MMDKVTTIMATGKYILVGLLMVFGMTVKAQEIKWMTWEQADAANAKQPRKIFVDLYTDWCGWCKKMDATSFKDPAVVKLMGEKFYAVKLNAEQKEAINWRGSSFEWVAGGRGGVHRLAYELVDGRLSYPTFVILDEEFRRIMISPGYKPGEELIKELQFASGNHYMNTTWEQYKAKL